MRALGGAALAPNVSTLCLLGAGLPTLAEMAWAGDAVSGPPSRASFAPGDPAARPHPLREVSMD